MYIRTYYTGNTKIIAFFLYYELVRTSFSFTVG